MSEIKLGKYQHYKGNSYEVLGVAKSSENKDENFVIYKQLYDGPEFPMGTLWVRPKEMFFEQVEINGQKVPRFKFIRENLLAEVEHDIVQKKKSSKPVSSPKEMKSYLSSL